MNKYEAKLYLCSKQEINTLNILNFSSPPLYIFFGTVIELKKIIEKNKEKIIDYTIEVLYRNKLTEYYDLSNSNARIEYGSIIRSGVLLSDKAIVLMGAVINKGAFIDDYSMIDMNAVVGSGAIIGKYCHIGAGAVIAGVMEPISSMPVVIKDKVFIGANATILSGVIIGENSIVGAGSVVTKDVLPHTTVVGIPAKEINQNQEWDYNKELR